MSAEKIAEETQDVEVVKDKPPSEAMWNVSLGDIFVASMGTKNGGLCERALRSCIFSGAS